MSPTRAPQRSPEDRSRPAGPDSPVLVAAGLDSHAVGRLASAARLGSWSLAEARGVRDAEHLAATSHAIGIVVPAVEDVDSAIRHLQRRRPELPVLVWAGGASSDTAGGVLLSGAAEVLMSRMGDLELFARMTRCIGAGAANRGALVAATIGELSVDSFRGEATWRGEPLALTNRERDVLEVLVREQGRTLRRQVIYQRVWGHSMPAGDRNVDVNVNRLRDKLAAGTEGAVTITTVSRVGYRLVTPEPSPSKDP